EQAGRVREGRAEAGHDRSLSRFEARRLRAPLQRPLDARRQIEHELAAAPRPVAVRGQLAAVQRDEPARKMQADAETARARARRWLRLGELVEDLVERVASDSDSGVAHADTDAGAVTHGANRDR